MPEPTSQTKSATLDTPPAIVALIAPTGTITAVNEAWRKQLGSAFEVGRNWFDRDSAPKSGLLAPSDEQLTGIRRVIEGASAQYTAEYETDLAAGNRRFRLMVTPLKEGDSVTGAVVVQLDVSDRKETEERLRKVNRLYAVLGGINEAITRARDPRDLCERACGVAVESGGMLMAWVGEVDEATRRIRPIAGAGMDDGYIANVSQSIDDRVLTGGPFGTALRTGRVDVSNDIAADPRMLPVRESALARGYRSAAALPIMVGGRAVAVFMFYAETSGFFQEADFKLMQAISDDISFAFESMNAERERQKAEESLRQSEERYRQLFEKNPLPMWVYDPDSLRILTVNRAAVAQYGYSEAEFRSMTLRDIRPAEDVPKLEAEVAALGDEPRTGQIGRHRRKDGTLIDVEVNADSIMIDGRPARLVLANDISERVKAVRRTDAFSDLGRALNSARTPSEAGEIILGIADRLIGWDAGTFDLSDEAGDRVVSVLNIDLIDGKKCPCPPAYTYRPGSSTTRRTILHGAQLILRKPGEGLTSDAVPFGDTGRPSASLLFAPVRDGARVVGVLSVQSYRWNAYNEDDLATLQALADYCGGAMSRIQAESDVKAGEAAMAEAQRIAQMGNWFVDLPPVRVYWSDPICRIHGVPPGTSPTMDEAFGFIVPEARGPMETRFKASMKHGVPFDEQVRIVRQDGQLAWLRVLGEPVRDEGGTVRRIQGAIQDITALKKAELHMAAFSELGRRLNSATTIPDAGEIVVQVADELIGWDAATFNLTNEDGTLMVSQLNIDTVDGRKTPFPPFYKNTPASALSRRTILEGAQLLLREEDPMSDLGGVRFGDTGRPSLSLMFVPVRDETRVIGVLSIQSYRPNAYDSSDLETLQALADHCSGAMCRLQAEAGLRASQAAMFEAQRIAQTGNWFVDLPPSRVYWSPEICALHGVPPGTEPTAAEAFGHIAPEFREKISRRFQACAREGVPFEEEILIIRSDGEPVWARVLAEAVHDADGVIRRVQGAMQNITARKCAEEALQKKTELLSVVTRSLNAFLENRDWKEAMGQLLGAALKETSSEYGFVGVMVDGPSLRILAHKGVKWDTVINRDFYESALKTYDEKGYLEFTSFDNLFGLVVKTGEVVVANDPATHPNRKGRPAGHPPMRNFLGVPIHQAGEVVGLIGVANRPGGYTAADQEKLQTLIQQLGTLCDSYRSIEREEALRAESRKAGERIAEQAALIDEARDAFVVRDLGHRVQFWSKGAERLYGWTSEEALGERTEALLQIDPGAFKNADEAVLRDGQWSGEFAETNKDGTAIAVDARWTLLRDDDGVPHSILSIDSDITDKKRTQAHFLRAQRMEGIGTLAGGIAHDLNNVLAPILMSLELLKETLSAPGDVELLTTLETSAQRGADLVRQVLTFARGIEGQRVAIEPSKLVRDLQKIVRDTFPKSIELRVSLAEGLWNLIGDPTQLHQVLLNLAVNARDAMPNGGRLTISTENALLDESDVEMNPGTKAGAYVCLKVADSGSGIPADVRERIFEPFFTTKELGKGTGLGLSTTMAIVKSHGGFINLYSEPGNGAVFKVYLPAEPALAESEATRKSPPQFPSGNGELVLVVDDEEAIRKVAQKTMERFGYRVVTAQNGVEALSIYADRRDEVAVVVTDMAMPVMDGPALIKALKAANPGVRIIACSGFNSNDGIKSAMDDGIDHFIPKPYMVEVMLKTLAKVLGRGDAAE